MLTLSEAHDRLFALVAQSTAAERLPLSEAAGYVLAETLLAPFDIPLFDSSMMDGYAVYTDGRSDDLPPLAVAGESKAGSPLVALAANTTCRIFTGAMIPKGANAVVMQENAEWKNGRVFFSGKLQEGQHIRFRGGDLKQGEIALEKGVRLGPAHLALAATVERSDLRVTRRPKVFIVVTGDELREPGKAGAAGSIPESNAVAIATMARRVNADVTILPYLPDDQAVITRALTDALTRCDLLVTIGGVSVGDYDVVRPALEAANVQLDFWRVAIKPGKPICVGKSEHAIVLGLPGNPASAMITFALFGVPLLRKLQGETMHLPVPRRAILTHSLDRKGGRLEFARATFMGDRATFVKQQTSASVLGMAQANALVVLGPDQTHVDVGDAVEVLPFSEIGL